MMSERWVAVVQEPVDVYFPISPPKRYAWDFGTKEELAKRWTRSNLKAQRWLLVEYLPVMSKVNV
jgi:hypothetical protein